MTQQEEAEWWREVSASTIFISLISLFRFFFGSSFLSVMLERAEMKLDIQVMFQKFKNLNPNHIDVCCPLCFLCLRSWSVAATWTTAMVWLTWRCFTTAVRPEHMELVRYLIDIDPISQSALQHLQEGNQRKSVASLTLLTENPKKRPKSTMSRFCPQVIVCLAKVW